MALNKCRDECIEIERRLASVQTYQMQLNAHKAFRKVLTNNKYILLYNTWRIGADLTFIRSFVFFYHRFDFQLPVIRVLEFNFIATISWIRLLAHRQQFQTAFARLSSYPWYLRVIKSVSERVFIYCWNWILPFEWKKWKHKKSEAE